MRIERTRRAPVIRHVSSRMKALLTVLFCVIASQVIQAEDSIETKYYEAAVNGAKEINLKSWKTYRAGKLVHEYTETDLVRDGTASPRNGSKCSPGRNPEGPEGDLLSP